MGTLPGDRPDPQRNFHDSGGQHRFPHPDTYEPRRSRWSTWEKRYAAHLDRHRELSTNPEPMDGDSETVAALFEHIGVLEQIIAKEKKLIIALRQRAAEHPEADEADLPGLRSAIQRGGTRS